MAIVNNVGCPECMKNGHDKTQNHLIVFDDGAKYCSRSHFHTSKQPYYETAEGGQAMTELPINGTIKYTPSQFRELEKEGKIADPKLRAIAIGGMRMSDRWEVMTDEERAAQQEEWKLDVEHLETLRFKNLVTRHIRGEIAKFYGIRVGLDANQQVARHYYPRYEQGELVGAKCRTLPKDFKSGHLGKLFGKQDLQGSQTVRDVMASGRRKDTLLIVGGELDMAAAQQMLYFSQEGTKFAGQYYHVWSPNKGETCIQEMIDNREDIESFRKVIWALDNDEAGIEATKELCRLFPSRSFVLKYPKGCKDANKCLMTGNHQEFVDAWFNAKPASEIFPSAVKAVGSERERLKAGRPAQGLTWPWPKLNKITLGIRPNQMIVVGAGSGVGKTEFLREVVYKLVEDHNEPVGIISTEDPYVKVARSFIGKWIDKRIELPPTNDPQHEDYRELMDYTDEDANNAIDYVGDKNLVYIADLEGDASMENIERICLEFEAMGIRKILIDNLTGIQLPEKEYGGKVGALDECVKRLGQIKDRKPVTIFLVTHLNRPEKGRTPHEEGGEVMLRDMRGSGAIGFWASYVLCPERNTRAETLDERTTTYIACVKDRDQGIYTGERVKLKGELSTGRLREADEWEQVRHQKERNASAVPSELPPNIDEGDEPPFPIDQPEF